MSYDEIIFCKRVLRICTEVWFIFKQKFSSVPGIIFSADWKNNIMKRDGACTSLWQDTVTDFILRQGETNNKVFDVVIVGGV